MKKIQLLFLLIILASCSKQQKEIITVSSEEIIIDFNSNEKEAIKKYRNKTVQIKGVVILKEFAKDNIPSKNIADIIFGKTDEKKWLFFEGNTVLICKFNDLSILTINENDEIIVDSVFKKFKKNINSFGMNEIIFVNSKIISLNSKSRTELTKNCMQSNF